MIFNDIIRRYRPVYEQEDGSGQGTPDGDVGGDDDGAGAGDGGDTPAGSPAPILAAGAADDGEADAGEDGASDDKGKPEDGKPEEKGEDGDDAVPEGDYTFEMPEGMELDTGMVETMSPIFKELGITQGQANALVAAYGGQVQAAAEASAEQFVTTVTGWTEAAKSDPEIGNDNWTATTVAANAALQKLGTPELTKALGETGMSNHPEMIRFMARTAKAIGADDFVPGEQIDTGDVTTEVSWYGKTTPTSKKG